MRFPVRRFVVVSLSRTATLPLIVFSFVFVFLISSFVLPQFCLIVALFRRQMLLIVAVVALSLVLSLVIVVVFFPSLVVVVVQFWLIVVYRDIATALHIYPKSIRCMDAFSSAKVGQRIRAISAMLS